jgi:hypothetical protein
VAVREGLMLLLEVMEVLVVVSVEMEELSLLAQELLDKVLMVG